MDRAEGVAGAIEELSYALHKESVRRQVERALSSSFTRKRLQKELNRRPYGGALIVISYHTYSSRDGLVYSNINAFVEGWAASPEYAYVRYRQSDKLYSAPSRGWRRGEDFLWIESGVFNDPVAMNFDSIDTRVCLVPDPFASSGRGFVLDGRQ